MGHRNAWESLRSVGGAHEARAEVVRATSREQVLEVFRRAREGGRRVTLLGGRRSMGDQFLPPEDALGLDVAELDRCARWGRPVEVLEVDAGGSIWVRVGGGTRFLDLRRLFPEHRPHCPPTTDTITLAGALAACTHNSFAYFADSVRAFSLVTTSGEIARCARDGDEREKERFFGVIGAFGALGVVTDVEIFLEKVEPGQQVVVHAIYAGPSRGGAYLDELEKTVDSGLYREGAGAFVYGREGHSIVLGDEGLPPGARHAGPRSPLMDDDVESHALTQSLANRFPRVAEFLVSRSFQPGAALWGPWYGFSFYQRGYDRAETVLSRNTLRVRLLRAVGVKSLLPVLHQSWFFPRAETRAVFSIYWEVLGRYPGLERYVEQQDLVLLPAVTYPSHSVGVTSEPVGVLTASFSAHSDFVQERGRAFLAEFSEEAWRRIPSVKISLCKQVHCDPGVLRGMHAEWIARVDRLRRELDPEGLLGSRLLDRLGVGARR